MPENPSTIDASGAAGGKVVTLYGTVERENLKPSDTGSWGAAVYYLDLPAPVTITHNYPSSQPETRKYQRVQFFIEPKEASDNSELAWNPANISTAYDTYVGKPVSITGKLYDEATKYYREGASFLDFEIAELEGVEPAPAKKEEPEEPQLSQHQQSNLDTAQEFLALLYSDHDSYSGRTMGELTDNGGLQSGWPNHRNLTIDRLEATDENTVEYELTCEETGNIDSNDWVVKHYYGTLTFTDESHVDVWLPDGMDHNRLQRF